MNVSTIGFPFASPAGTPALGGAEQGFALALGAVSGFGVPAFPSTAPAMGDATKAPTLPADARTAAADTATLVRTQPTSTITLAQLLATGSKLPPVDAADVKVRPDQTTAAAPGATEAKAEIAVEVTADLPAPVLPDAQTQTPAKPVATDGKAPPDPKTAATADPALALASTPAPQAAAPVQGAKPADIATTVKTDPNAAVACATAEGEQPMLADLPVATRPTRGPAAAPAPVKARKPGAAETPLPADQPTTQPVAAPVAVPVAVAAPTSQPAPAAPAAERKADAGRGSSKPVTSTLAQGDVPIADGADSTVAKPANPYDEKSGNGSPSDAGLPVETMKVEGKAAAPATPQSFAAQVNQAAASAPAHAAMPASATPAAPAADPMISARAGQLGHALGVEIARKVDAGEDTLRVRLNPVELGRVEVTLAFDDRGNLRATMRAESQHALELLRQDAPDLGRALDSAGIRADAQSFRFESRSDGNGSSSMGGQSGQHQSRGNGQHAFHDEPETAAPAYRAIRNDGQVDLLA